MALTKLTKRNIIGTWYLHRFKKSNGDVYEIECTKQEYEALAVKDAGQPTKGSDTWILSRSGAKFDSQDGHLGELDYWEKGDKCLVISDGKHYMVDKTDITNDEIDSSKISGG